MSLSEIVAHGLLNADGTLRLDEKPDLPPGRVRVTIRPEQEAKLESLADAYLQLMAEIRAAQRARGHIARPSDEAEAERRALRQEMDAELEAAVQLQEDCRRRRAQDDGEATTP